MWIDKIEYMDEIYFIALPDSLNFQPVLGIEEDQEGIEPVLCQENSPNAP